MPIIRTFKKSKFNLSFKGNICRAGLADMKLVNILSKNIKKYILVFGEVLTQGLDNSAKTATAKYFISFNTSKKEILFKSALQWNNSLLFVTGLKLNQFNAKDSEIKSYPLCLGIISVDNMKKTYDFSIPYNTTGVSDIVDIHKYLMKKHNIR